MRRPRGTSDLTQALQTMLWNTPGTKVSRNPVAGQEHDILTLVGIGPPNVGLDVAHE
jgi:hypothetical protein